jgi:DNA-binding transcriptional LysR family regulator
LQLRDVDLNLLVIFEALYETRHVTRAAKRVALSQPAFSNALARLRGAMGDPLFVKTPKAMVPTARADAMIGPVRAALGTLRAALAAPAPFTPKTAQAHVTIGVTDYAELVFLPRLAERLRAQAPGIKVEMRKARERSPTAELATGELDLTIGRFDDAGGGLKRRKLFDETFRCAIARTHPLARRELKLADYLAAKHVLVAPFGGLSSSVDELLAASGHRREVVMGTPHFLTAMFVVAHTDLVTTVPHRIATIAASSFPLVLKAPPLRLPGFDLAMGWHERTHHEGAHRWVREQIAQIAASG